jgi:hypothetical protein
MHMTRARLLAGHKKQSRWMFSLSVRFGDVYRNGKRELTTVCEGALSRSIGHRCEVFLGFTYVQFFFNSYCMTHAASSVGFLYIFYIAPNRYFFHFCYFCVFDCVFIFLCYIFRNFFCLFYPPFLFFVCFLLSCSFPYVIILGPLSFALFYMHLVPCICLFYFVSSF